MAGWTRMLSKIYILFIFLIFNHCLALEIENLDKENVKLNSKSELDVLSKANQKNENSPGSLTKNHQIKTNKISKSISKVDEFGYNVEETTLMNQTGEKIPIKGWISDDEAVEEGGYEDNLLDSNDEPDDDESEDSMLLAKEATPKTKTVPNHNDDDTDSSDQITKDFLGFGSDMSEIDHLNEIADEDGFDGVKPEVHLPKSSQTSNPISEERLIVYGSSFGNHVGQIMLCLTMVVALVIVVYIVYLNNPTAIRLVQGKYQEWKYPGKTFVHLDPELGDPLLSRKNDYHP